MTGLRRTTHPSPVGELFLVADVSGLRAVLWRDDDPVGRRGAAEPGSCDPDEVIDRTVEQLDEYFAGERTTFDLPLAPVGTPFQLASWSVLRTIPYGATMTYGQQAVALGDRNKARAVGAANGRNPLSIVVPCHRVCGADGSLTGFGGGIEQKAWLLDHERRVLLAAPAESAVTVQSAAAEVTAEPAVKSASAGAG